jgi:hypothetical protein
MPDNFDEIVEEIKSSPKTKIKWICPVCEGQELRKQKVICESENLDIQVTTGLGELYVEVSNEDEEIIKKTKFPIRYCPWCGRKVRERYRK